MTSWFSSMNLATSPTTSAETWVWSNVSPSMKMKASPSLYRYCMVRLSTLAVSTLVPALNVFSTTLPDRTAFSLVRTKAGPLPGLTCWNSTTDQSWLPMLRTMPFFRSLVEAKRASLSYDGWLAGLRRRQRECSSPPWDNTRDAVHPSGWAPCPRLRDLPALSGPAPEGRADRSQNRIRRSYQWRHPQ